jgi:hypothetical protein
MYDSVYVFAKALAAVDRGHVLWPANLSCDLEQPWKDGLTLYNYISSVSNDYKLMLLHSKRQGKVGHHDFDSWSGDYLNSEYISAPSGNCWGEEVTYFSVTLTDITLPETCS